MSLVQKLGQCFVMGYADAVPTVQLMRRIREYNPAGVGLGLTMR